MKKRLLPLLLLPLLVLTACGDYAKADQTPPATWAAYECHGLTFRFMAGWTPVSHEALQQAAGEVLTGLDSENRLSLLGHYASPLQATGTTNYLSLGYYTMASDITAADLEGIMEELNNLDDVLSVDTTDTKFLQKCRIRTYAGQPALTLALRSVRGDVTMVSQVALVPQGRFLYLIVYSDFSTGEDNSVLEQLLTSLSLENRP